MATGPVNSRPAVDAPAILRVGEQVTTTAAALAASSGKTYYHRVPGAQTHMPDGLAIVFMGGMFTTADPEIIAYLDRIVDRPASGVFSNPANTVLKRAELLASDDAAQNAGTAITA